MKKISILFAGLVAFSSCTKNIEDLNQNVKDPSIVPPGSLFANAQKEMQDIMTDANVNRNIFRLITQQWTQTTYIDESNYDLNTRNIPQNFWSIIYRDVLNNLQKSADLVPTQDSKYVSDAQKKNQLAQIKVMRAYAYSVLVNTFGNVPYTQALKVDLYPNPAYDDAKTVESSLIDELNAAINDFDASASGFASSDLLLSDGISKWVKLANSLKLRLGMILADVDAAKAKATVEAASANLIGSNSENVIFHYLAAPPNTNPIWVDLVQSGRQDFVAANTLVDTMKSLSDPRIPFYFSNDANGGFTGGTYGSNNNYATYSKPSDKVIRPDFESILIDYAEVEFLLAEAVERGFNVSGTAASHYNNAVTASIKYWGGSDADAAAYLANPAVNYATAPGNWKAKIGFQKWIALYNRGFDAWTEWRRLDNPELKAPVDAVSVIPVRYTYPVNEQTLNPKNYKAASSAIGGDGDAVSTKLFWDVF